MSYAKRLKILYKVMFFGYVYCLAQGPTFYFQLHTLVAVISEMIASGASCPTPGQVPPGHGTRNSGYMGQDASGNGAKGHHE